MGTWNVKRINDVITVTYNGHLEEPDGTTAAREAERLMGDDRIHFVADFLDLTSYSPAVRKAWTAIFIERRKQIRTITLASTRPVVRMGVAAFALAVGAPCKIVGSRDELTAKEYSGIGSSRRRAHESD